MTFKLPEEPIALRRFYGIPNKICERPVCVISAYHVCRDDIFNTLWAGARANTLRSKLIREFDLQANEGLAITHRFLIDPLKRSLPPEADFIHVVNFALKADRKRRISKNRQTSWRGPFHGLMVEISLFAPLDKNFQPVEKISTLVDKKNGDESRIVRTASVHDFYNNDKDPGLKIGGACYAAIRDFFARSLADVTGCEPGNKTPPEKVLSRMKNALSFNHTLFHYTS